MIDTCNDRRQGLFVLTALMSDFYTNVVSLSLERYIGDRVLSTSSASFIDLSHRDIRSAFSRLYTGISAPNHQPFDGLLHGGRDLSLASDDRCHAADDFSRAGHYSPSDSRCPRKAMVFQSDELTGTHLKPILSPVVPRE